MDQEFSHRSIKKLSVNCNFNQCILQSTMPDDRAWALVGVQSLLCTLTFLALLYLNFQIWHQYFFLILWAFILSHAFKATLDDLQEWADNLSTFIAKAPRKRLLCQLCVGIFRQPNRVHPANQTTWCSLPQRLYTRMIKFAG